MGVALLGWCVVIRGNLGHAKVTPTIIFYLYLKATSGINKLKMAIAMLDHEDRLFGLPTGLFCIGCFTTELGARGAEGLGAGLK